MALAIALTSSCGTLPGAQGNPAAPVIVSGQVLDGERRPVRNAALFLTVVDGLAPAPNGALSVIYSETFTANGDGTFAIHLFPTPVMVDLAARQGGLVPFLLVVRPQDGSFDQEFGFSWAILNGQWLVERGSAGVLITPNGVEISTTPAPPPPAGP